MQSSHVNLMNTDKLKQAEPAQKCAGVHISNFFSPKLIETILGYLNTVNKFFEINFLH